VDYKEEGRKKTQKEDWKALARDKKESRSLIAEAKKKHVKKLKGITCTAELNKGEKKGLPRVHQAWQFQVPAEVGRAGLEAPG